MKKKNWNDKLKVWLNMDKKCNLVYGCIDEIGFSWRCENCKDFQCDKRNVNVLNAIK